MDSGVLLQQPETQEGSRKGTGTGDGARAALHPESFSIGGCAIHGLRNRALASAGVVSWSAIDAWTYLETARGALPIRELRSGQRPLMSLAHRLVGAHGSGATTDARLGLVLESDGAPSRPTQRYV